jgi:hypothetical protein
MFAMKKYYFSLCLLFTIMTGVFFVEETPAAPTPVRLGNMPDRLQGRSLALNRSERDLGEIIGILENRIKHYRLPAKAVHKLSSMTDEDFRLVLSLCDRMVKEGDSASADVAFFLITAMIIVS